MAERYKRLYRLPDDLYAAGAPVLAAAGALLQDTQTGKVLAQLKFRSINDTEIKALTVEITALDTAGRPLGEPVIYQYLDLSAKRDDEFGQKIPVYLPDASTRSYTVRVTEAVFHDGTVWTGSNGEWSELKAQRQLVNVWNDAELVKQFRLNYGKSCDKELIEDRDLWRCPCGHINHNREATCPVCKSEKAAFLHFSLDELKEQTAERVAAEKAEQERRAAEAEAKRREEEIAAKEKQEEAAKKRKKTVKTVCIAALAVIVVGTASFAAVKLVQKNNQYQNALALMESGDYTASIEAFRALDGYRDSDAQIEDIQQKQYDAACAALDDEDYEGAITIFEELGDYKDSTEQAQNAAAYQDAVTLVHSGKYSDAQNAFEALGDYRDSPEQAQNAGDYQQAKSFLLSGKNIEARDAFLALGDYRDSAEQADKAEESAYQDAKSQWNNGHYSAAATVFEQLEDYPDAAAYVEKYGADSDSYDKLEQAYTKSKKSLVDGSQLLSEIPDDFAPAKELRDVCEKYAPMIAYTGNYCILMSNQYVYFNIFFTYQDKKACLHSVVTGTNELSVNGISVLDGTFPTLDLEGMSASSETDVEGTKLVYRIDMLDGNQLKLYGTLGERNITPVYAEKVTVE